MFKRVLLVLLLSSAACTWAQTAAIQGFCDLGGTPAKTSGLNSTNYLQGVIPSCTVTVYLTGTTTKATIYADGNNAPLSNPFTASALGSVAPGQWLFFAAVNQGYDVVMSGGIAPNTYPQPVTLTGLFPGQFFTPPFTTQTNGTLNASQSLLNFTNSTDCTWTNPSGGVEQVSCGLSGALQMQVPDPLGTQSVLVPFTVATNNLDGGSPCFATSNTTSGQVGFTGGGSNLGCEAPPGPSITWSAAQLPAYVNPANVTAIYAVGTVGYVGSSQRLNLVCSNPTPNTTVLMDGGTIGGTDTGVLKAYSAQLTWATGANIGTISCVAKVAANALGADNPSMNIPSIYLRVYYTGTAPPASTALNVMPCLYINSALNSMGVSAVNLAGTGDCGVIGLLPQANLAPPTQTTLNGTTAGAAVWVETAQFGTWKHAAIYLNGYENTTATAQTITLPAGFSTVSAVLTDSGTCTGVTVSGATVTLPASMGAPQTGLCEIRGW